MNITLRPKANSERILTIYIEDEAWRDIHTSVFGKKPFLPQFCGSMNEWQERFGHLEYRQALDYAFKKLSQKGYLKQQLIESMKRKLISDEAIRKVTTECESKGFLNDQDWVFLYVESCQRRKVGPHMIAQKLRAKGAPEDLIKEALGVLDVGDKRKEQMRALIESRYKSRDLTQHREREKVIAALVRKGYIVPEIREVIDEVLSHKTLL